MKVEQQMRNEMFEVKENENEKWVERALKDCVVDLGKLVDKRLVENEVVVRKILLKGGNNGEGVKSDELKALKEKNLLEYVDTMVKNIKFEILHEVEEEKAKKNNRFDEVTRLIQTHKSLLDEHI